MGEKIPYKARKPGGGRKKRKPEYDAGKKRKSTTAQLDFTSLIAEKAKKAELEETIQKLMADGVSAAEILEKLK